MNRSITIVVFLVVFVGCYIYFNDIYAKNKLTVGSKAPDFSLTANDGNTYTLSELLKTHAKVALVFYPKDNTPYCTQEVCSLSTGNNILKENGICVLGISQDSLESHATFAAEHSLNFPLLSDPKGKVIKEYGVNGTIANKRRTFLIDKNQIIIGIIDGNDIDVNNHADQIIEAFNNHGK